MARSGDPVVRRIVEKLYGPPEPLEPVRSADFWLGQAAAFRAIERLESTVSPGLRAWAGAEAWLAERAAGQVTS
jgi:hypothetical protein